MFAFSISSAWAFDAVTITEPLYGATVSSPVTVCMETWGVQVQAAKKGVNPGRGHHHLLIDVALPTDLSRVMKDQRNFNLDEIIRGIQKIWKIFFPYEDRELLFDDKYLPYFEKGGETITFNNASAGEKMILLILIKIALARKYTAIPFLIFDEPLEHLNYENRINIINYLIDICRKGLVKQLIITTFEESLTRRFRKMEEVNVISLPSYLKY